MWATIAATYCPGRMVEYPKSESTGGVTVLMCHPVDSPPIHHATMTTISSQNARNFLKKVEQVGNQLEGNGPTDSRVMVMISNGKSGLIFEIRSPLIHVHVTKALSQISSKRNTQLIVYKQKF